MKNSATFLSALLSLAACNQSATPVQLVHSQTDESFLELFGIDEERASRDLPKSLFQCLQRAHEDFNLALKDKPPKHAQPRGAFSDGGTSLWEDPCYSLVNFHQLTLICEKGEGLNGAIFGPELRIHPTMTDAKFAPISRTRFVTMEIGKIEGAEYHGCAP